MRRSPWLLILMSAFLVAGCSRTARVAGPPEVAGTDAATPELASVPPAANAPGRPPLAADTAFEEGQASWYGDPYHGRRAASGEVFDKNKLTAAHRTLAFDTWVRVENQSNGRTVDVRINDRGPFVEGRIIDLSEAAARELDMIRAGVVPVRVSVLGRPEQARAVVADDVFYVVQLGAFREAANAQNLARRLGDRYTGIYVEAPANGSALHRVLIGRAVLSDARRVQSQLRAQDGIEAIVVEVAE